MRRFSRGALIFGVPILAVAWLLTGNLPQSAIAFDPVDTADAADVIPADEQVDVEPPSQWDQPPVVAPLHDVGDFIELNQARAQFEQGNFRLDGAGLTVAVVDSGLRVDHVDFTSQPGRIPAQRNFTADNNGNVNDASDGNGHGSHVAGIIAASSDLHEGIAPAARVIPLKVLKNNENQGPRVPTVFDRTEKALRWILNNHNQHGITAVNLSISNARRMVDDSQFPAGGTKDRVRRLIQQLRIERIPVVVAAGNEYCKGNNVTLSNRARQGMGFPAVIRETISVGAVYSHNHTFEHVHDPYHRAKSHFIVAGQITPFSNRLHESLNPNTQTDVFAPGGFRTESTGQTGITSHSQYDFGGTSQAAPIVTGVVLLVQQFYRAQAGHLPTVDQLEVWLRKGSVKIDDGDDEYDNVRHTCKDYRRLDVYLTLSAVQQSLQQALARGEPLGDPVSATSPRTDFAK